LSVPLHPFGTLPQFLPSSWQVFGVHVASHFPPSHRWPMGQPHMMFPPQLSDIMPQKPLPGQLAGVQTHWWSRQVLPPGQEPHWRVMPQVVWLPHL
jgi:hypothetical protein